MTGAAGASGPAEMGSGLASERPSPLYHEVRGIWRLTLSRVRSPLRLEEGECRFYRAYGCGRRLCLQLSARSHPCYCRTPQPRARVASRLRLFLGHPTDSGQSYGNFLFSLSDHQSWFKKGNRAWSAKSPQERPVPPLSPSRLILMYLLSLGQPVFACLSLAGSLLTQLSM